MWCTTSCSKQVGCGALVRISPPAFETARPQKCCSSADRRPSYLPRPVSCADHVRRERTGKLRRCPNLRKSNITLQARTHARTHAQAAAQPTLVELRDRDTVRRRLDPGEEERGARLARVADPTPRKPVCTSRSSPEPQLSAIYMPSRRALCCALLRSSSRLGSDNWAVTTTGSPIDEHSALAEALKRSLRRIHSTRGPTTYTNYLATSLHPAASTRPPRAEIHRFRRGSIGGAIWCPLLPAEPTLDRL